MLGMFPTVNRIVSDLEELKSEFSRLKKSNSELISINNGLLQHICSSGNQLSSMVELNKGLTNNEKMESSNPSIENDTGNDAENEQENDQENDDFETIDALDAIKDYLKTEILELKTTNFEQTKINNELKDDIVELKSKISHYDQIIDKLQSDIFYMSQYIR